MSNAENSPVRSPYISSGVVLAAMSLIVVSGGLLIWNHREPVSDVRFAELEPVEATVLRPRALPMPIAAQLDAGVQQPPLHGVTYGVENGTAIVKIRVVADGDELIVDANTGRLIESRPNRPSAPPPLGKFAAPFVPMM